MIVYIPGLRKLIANRESLLQTKLKPASSAGIIDVRERQTMYIISATVGESFFDSITVDYSRDTITFNQVNRSNRLLAEAVIKALREFGIEEFLPQSLSFCMFSPNNKKE